METHYVKYLTDTEFKVLVSAFNKVNSPSMRLCLFFLAFTGARVSDVVRIKVTDINMDVTRINIIQKKTKKPLEIVIPSFLKPLIEDYVELYNNFFRDDYLFFPFNNQSINDHIQEVSVRIIFNRIRNSLGLTDTYYITKNGIKLHRVSIHTLRHYFEYKVYKSSGNDLFFVKGLMNYSKIDTLANYINSFGASINKQSIIEKAFIE